MRLACLAAMTGLLALNLAHAASPCQASSGPRVVPLVELFTSEGCDSCPPADRWLSATFPPGRSDASVLAFHVDYWDRLGWKDRFASAQYTARQRAAMRANGATFVYTPQVLVQGRDVETSRRGRAVDAARTMAARASIRLETGPAKVTVRAEVDASARRDVALWLAYTDSGLVTNVKAGENSGARLTHDHVVRALYGPFAVDKAVEVAIAHPAERGQHPALVAFVQNAVTGEVLQTLTLPACQ